MGNQSAECVGWERRTVSNDWMDVNSVHTLWIGDHASWMMSMQSVPSVYTFGWNISLVNLIRGGFSGYCSPKVILREKTPPATGRRDGFVKKNAVSALKVFRREMAGRGERNEAPLRTRTFPRGLVRPEDSGAPHEQVIVAVRARAAPIRGLGSDRL